MSFGLSSSSSGFQFPNSNSLFGNTKVFVRGFAWETHSDAIGRYFYQFDQFLEAVTFHELEVAARACANPISIIDGRCTNCNLASLRRPRPPMPYGRPRPTSPYIGGIQATRRAYTGGYGYQQPLSYNYQQGLVYPPCGYATYGPEYAYSQGTVTTFSYPYEQLGQTIPGDQGYPTVHGYAMLAQQIIQFGAPSVNEVTTSTVPPIQATYHTTVKQKQGAGRSRKAKDKLPINSITIPFVYQVERQKAKAQSKKR
ncbi:unnamed protein product [Malus baccata var. baccata]